MTHTEQNMRGGQQPRVPQIEKMQEEILTQSCFHHLFRMRLNKMRAPLWHAPVGNDHMRADVSVPMDHEDFFSFRHVLKLVQQLWIDCVRKVRTRQTQERVNMLRCRTIIRGRTCDLCCNKNNKT